MIDVGSEASNSCWKVDQSGNHELVWKHSLFTPIRTQQESAGITLPHGGPKQHLPELSQLYPSSKGQGDIETRTAECTFGAAVGRHPKKDAECPAQKILLTHKRGYPSGYECMMFLRANRTMRIVYEFASNNYHIEYFAHINRGLMG
ncbi:hypothetical protein PABG_03312 [Paracoccidioides brasiliensis Pb03]|nr:hypothetical protein PABG_03312 [Paracoccidioides brasiliensis Pb03]